MLSQAKQIQLDDLLAKLDGTAGELEHLRDEKDQEIAILQEGMDSTLQQLSEVQQVCSGKLSSVGCWLTTKT